MQFIRIVRCIVHNASAQYLHSYNSQCLPYADAKQQDGLCIEYIFASLRPLITPEHVLFPVHIAVNISGGGGRVDS